MSGRQPRCTVTGCVHMKTAHGHCNVVTCPNARNDCPVPGHMR